MRRVGKIAWHDYTEYPVPVGDFAHAVRPSLDRVGNAPVRTEPNISA